MIAGGVQLRRRSLQAEHDSRGYDGRHHGRRRGRMRESETPARGPLPTREHRNHSIVGSKMIASGFDIRFERFARVIGKRFVLHEGADRKSTRLNSSHPSISYAVFCLKKKKKK